MITPNHWRMPESRHRRFIKDYPFATLFGPNQVVDHLPLHLDHEGQRLIGHCAKVNALWQTCHQAAVTAVFHGPHAYIPAHAYDTQPAVPTWNYAVLHVTGRFSALDEQATWSIIQSMHAQFESNVSQEEEQFQKNMLNGIVGFEIAIDAIVGKEKLGQHRKAVDQQAVLSHLKNSKATQAKDLVEYMDRTL